MTFGKKVANTRKKKGFSQAELAKQVDTISVTISRYEQDEIKPSIDIASKLADALNVSLDFLVGITDVELDKSIINKILTIQKLPQEDKEHIMHSYPTR
ncbi:helix-turn-helix domain-containing protein [Tenacibaculum sp. UWU-22]|uniref:helix-turn-helix domain-containing protein n=1 Tax=Tenacibaculum sp. UWU-22 TaxID=3234187 RepID=UPI0034DB17F0